MVKARKINVVDLNEIRAVDHTEANHTETDEPVEEIKSPDPIEEVIQTVETVKEIPKDVEIPKEVEVVKKCDVKATCAFCNKVMSVKALRYSHDKNCKGKQLIPVERTTTTRNKSPERTHEPPTPRNSVVKHEAESPQLIIPKARTTKAELRQQRFNHLVSQAF